MLISGFMLTQMDESGRKFLGQHINNNVFESRVTVSDLREFVVHFCADCELLRTINSPDSAISTETDEKRDITEARKGG